MEYCKIIQGQAPSVESSQSIGQPRVLATQGHGKLTTVYFIQLFFPCQVGTQGKILVNLSMPEQTSLRKGNVYLPFLLAAQIFVNDPLGTPFTWIQGQESIPHSLSQRKREKPLRVITVVFSHRTRDHR